MQLTRDRIDHLTDGELVAYAEQATGCTMIPLDGDGAFALCENAGRRGWEITIIHRAGLGRETLASVAKVPGWQASFRAAHARPEIAVFRVFLYAVHLPVPTP